MTKSVTVPMTCLLPIDLISWGGVRDKGEVALAWTIAHDDAVESYHIERRIEGIDEYEIIGISPSRGMQTQVEYRYKDQIPAHLSDKVAYYRLQTIHSNGKTE